MYVCSLNNVLVMARDELETVLEVDMVTMKAMVIFVLRKMMVLNIIARLANYIYTTGRTMGGVLWSSEIIFCEMFLSWRTMPGLIVRTFLMLL